MNDVLLTISAIVLGLGLWSYVIIFFVALLEAVSGLGFIVPGASVMLLTGIAAAHGTISLPVVLILGAVGAALGDNISYYLGRTYGASWIKKKKWFITDAHLASGEAYFKKHGGNSVFFGRFMPVVNKIIPFTAGTMNMDKKRFLLYNVLGACGWSLQWIGIGYLFSYSFHVARTWIARVDAMIVFLIFMYGAYVLYRYIAYRTTKI